MVDFAQDPETAGRVALDSVEAVDDIHLPQWLAEVERPADEPGALDAELTPVTRFGEGDVTDVEFDVEAAVLEPKGIVTVERDQGDAAPERRCQVETVLDVSHQALERHSLRSSRRVVDGQRTAVHRRLGGLRVEERRILRAELFTGGSISQAHARRPVPMVGDRMSRRGDNRRHIRPPPRPRTCGPRRSGGIPEVPD